MDSQYFAFCFWFCAKEVKTVPGEYSRSDVLEWIYLNQLALETAVNELTL